MNLEEACKVFEIAKKRSYAKKELKVRYRKLALKYHPDKGGTDERFTKITEAYTFLKEYTPPKPSSTTATQQKTESPKDTFGEKRKKRRKRPLDPQDITISIEVSVEELHKGFEQKVEYTRRKACENCHGSGCYICDGQLQHQQLEVGVYIHSTLMNNESEIIYEGFGEITYEAADLIIKIHLVKSRFSLEYKENLKFPVVTNSVLISKDQTEVFVLTLDGKVKVAIPKNNKGVLRLKGKGLNFNTTKGTIRGDHYVTLKYD